LIEGIIEKVVSNPIQEMFFVIRKLDLKWFFNGTFGSMKPSPLYLMRMFDNIQNSNKIIVIKDMTGWEGSNVYTFNAISFYMKIVKVCPGLKLNEWDNIAENEWIFPWKRNLPPNETKDILWGYHEFLHKTSWALSGMIPFDNHLDFPLEGFCQSEQHSSKTSCHVFQ
jgi:hypothetical protein